MLVKQHNLRIKRQRTAIATRCCWPPDNCAGYLAMLAESPTRATRIRAFSSAAALDRLITLTSAIVTLLRTAQCGQFETLEHHADRPRNAATS